MGGSFWQKDSLITHILSELWLITLLWIVLVFLTQTLPLSFLALVCKYRTRAIITRGLYIFNPLFKGQKHFFMEIFSENSVFMYGWCSGAVYN